MVSIKQNLVNPSKYGIKCPYLMTPSRIVVHNTANDASAKNEVAYMIRNNNEVSFHYAVDDKEIVQGIPTNRNSWNAGDGNGKGNREGISIEICYSKSGGSRWTKAQENAAEFVAYLLKDYGWGIEQVTKHQDYNGKNCPHRTLAEGWDKFIARVKHYLDPEIYRVRKAWDDPASQKGAYQDLNNAKKACDKAGYGYEVYNKAGQAVYSAPAPKVKKIDVTYQVWDDIKNAWLPNVVNDKDYAGIFGHDVCAVYANLSSGNIIYQVHYKGGKWLGEIKNRSDYAGIYNKPIDAIRMKTDTGKTIQYRVHLRAKKKWLGWVSGYSTTDSNNGYAGILGQEIDAIQIRIK